MPEHFTKRTVMARFWCLKCGQPTMHRVDSGRRGPCLVCLEKLKPGEVRGSKPEDFQMEMFGKK